MKNKIFKTILLFSILFIVSACGKKEIELPEENYPTVDITSYENMDKYETYIITDDIKYNYTFYFEDGVCANALVEISFDSEVKAQEYYESIKEDASYVEIKINDNIVSYYHNTENFIYMLYPKDVLINELTENGFLVE